MSKLYVVVRRDLTVEQRAIQAGHGLAEYLLNHKPTWYNGTLVYLGVSDERTLETLHHKLSNLGFDHAVFREPDLDDQITSLAGLGNNKMFRRMELL